MKLLIAAAMLAGTAIPAFAQTAAPVRAAAEEPALCTDRPTKANAVCTVPAGKVQIESDVLNWSRNRDAGTRTDVILYSNPTLKVGLGDDTDIQFNIAPYVAVRSRSAGASDTIKGVGDLTVRLKQRLTDPESKVQIGVIPFVKVPTARRGIGNRRVEGGLAMPVQVALPDGFSLTFGPEADLLLDGDGKGRHVQAVGLVNLGKAVSPKLTLYGEFWTAQNFDPAGTVRQYSADAAAAYLVSPKLQLDVGGNFGLNRATPDMQLYVGVSTRF